MRYFEIYLEGFWSTYVRTPSPIRDDKFDMCEDVLKLAVAAGVVSGPDANDIDSEGLGYVVELTEKEALTNGAQISIV